MHVLDPRAALAFAIGKFARCLRIKSSHESGLPDAAFAGTLM